jgi:hypothetical protein
MLARRRLLAQQIARPSFGSPGELVRFMGAVQAQDCRAAQWALGLRVPGSTEAAIERALAEGSLLRTHAMRWTWQLVAPEDVRWILELVAPRLLRSYAARRNELDLDAKIFSRASSVLEKTLADGAPRTRSELASALAAARIDASGPRLSHLLAHAELEGLITSGPRQGKQRTHVLLDRRVPKQKPLARDAALAELARRYFTSRGPATLADFVWWSGLTTADARAALEAIERSLVSEQIHGATYFRTDAARPAATPARALLLPAFDEYLVAYKDRGAMIDPAHARRVNAGGGILNPCIVIGGRVIGTWRRTLDRECVTVELAPFEKLAPRELERVARAARHYGEFLGLEARVTRRR